MLKMLLISIKNGKTVKTYGLKLGYCNMKIIFLCIITIISCSVCASGDLEIYPDLNFDAPPDEQRHRDPSQYSFRRWPWDPRIMDEYEENKKEPDFDFSLPEHLFDIEDFLERNRHNLHTTSRSRFDPAAIEKAYENLKNLENLRKYRLANDERYPTTQILNEVRPYPHEDDFSFKDDEYEDEKVYPQETDINFDEDDLDNSKKILSDKTNQDKSEQKTVNNIEFVDDPTKFAYPPSDPRFFLEKVTDDPSFGLTTNGKILLIPRSKSKIDSEISKDNTVEVVAVKPHIQDPESAGIYIIAIVAGISAAATVGLIAVGIGWYNLQKHVKNASDVEYPAYGVTGPNKDTSPSGDRRLAQSAQMYHYQHQKQQIIAMERAAAGERHGSVSEADSEEENEEGDYTVYECPGLAPTGEMEVKNPLFQDDPTPAQTSGGVNVNGDVKK